MKRDNRIIVDLNKCQWARLLYRNQYGQTSNTLPHLDTVRSINISKFDLAHPHPEYPGETEFERAKRLGLLDCWRAELTLKLQASEYLIYTGTKALSLFEAWNAKIFGEKK